MVKAINTWAVSLMRYSAGIVEWTKADIDVTDRKTRKLMTMYGMLHPRSNVSRLYLPRSEGGIGLLSVSDSVNIERRSLQCHVSSTQEKLLKVAQKYIKAEGVQESKKRRKNTRLPSLQTECHQQNPPNFLLSACHCSQVKLGPRGSELFSSDKVIFFGRLYNQTHLTNIVAVSFRIIPR